MLPARNGCGLMDGTELATAILPARNCGLMGGVGIDHSSRELGGLAGSERLRLDGWDGIGHCDLAGSELRLDGWSGN